MKVSLEFSKHAEFYDSYNIIQSKVVQKLISDITNTTKGKKMNVLVLAIGNSLMQDEGVGNHLLQRLMKEKEHWPVKYMDGGTLSFTLAGDIEQASHLIILDAANLKQQAVILCAKISYDIP